MIVAGKNFGCGSSREQACSCLKGYELTIVARGFARIFLQNSINLGLNLITAPDYEASEGDEIEVAGDRVVDKTTGKSFAVVPLPKARQAIIDAGGLIAYSARPAAPSRPQGIEEMVGLGGLMADALGEARGSRDRATATSSPRT